MGRYDEPMELDGLSKLPPPGPKGVGSLLERLEREALAEQAELEAAEKRAAQGSSSKANTSTTKDAGPPPVYVPGGGGAANKKRSPQTTTTTDTTSTMTTGGAVEAASPEVPPTSSNSINVLLTTTDLSSLPASSVPAAASAGSATNTAKPIPSGVSVGGGPVSSSMVNTNADSSMSAATSEPTVKKARRQPTIRMNFTWQPYPKDREALAKHVPIFNVHDKAEQAGLLLPPEEEAEDDGDVIVDGDNGGSSDSGNSDDEDGGDDDKKGADDEDTSMGPEMSEHQRIIEEARRAAERSGIVKRNKRRVRDRDEGYDTNDPFVDDSDLAINEPKFQPKPKMEGYVAIIGEVEIQEPDNPKARKGRKFGSVNKPKVVVRQPDGTTKLVSEAVAAREAKRQNRGLGVDGATAKRSESPAIASTSKGPLVSRDAIMYSHLPSSAAGGGGGGASASQAQSPPASSSASRPVSASTPQPTNEGSAPGSSVKAAISIDDEDDGDSKNASMPPVKKSDSATPAPISGIGATQKPLDASFTFEHSPAIKGGKRTYDYKAVHPKLQAALDRLNEAAKKESFVPKNKFPPDLKPILWDVAILAMNLKEYDDNFFNIMPSIFPYNRFTMQKMIKREVCAVRVQQLEDEIAGKMKELQEEIQRLLPPAMEAHQRAMEEWKLAHDEWASSRPRGAGGPGDAAYPTSDKDGSGVDAMARVGSDGRHMSLTPMGSDADTPSAPAAAGGSGLADKGPEQPKPKFRFSETARMLLLQIMSANIEIQDRLTDKAMAEAGFDESKAQIPSAHNSTKARYASLVKLWPKDWMSSNQLSRELTAAKRKIEKSLK